MNKKLTINKSILFKIIVIFSSVFLWLAIWEAASYFFGKTFLFPGAIETFITLTKLALKLDFWKTIFFSILRIFSGLILGIIFGIIAVILCKFIPVLNTFISIGMTVIKSTPVAAVIIILWMFINSSVLPIVIALLMVCPLIWQNLTDGFNSIDKDLIEVTQIYNFSKIKKFKYLIFPSLLKYFIPAVLTSVGLAWKSGIAAEIISYANLSIGKYIYDAKWAFEGNIMLAWTLTVVIISLVFELAIKSILRRLMKKYGH